MHDPTQFFVRFGEMIDDLVDRLMARFGRETAAAPPAIQPSTHTARTRQTLGGLVQRGLDHYDRLKKQQQVRSMMEGAYTAAALTRRAIRSVPRRERRSLFGAYRPVLKDAVNRVNLLYTQIGFSREQLKRHNLRELEAEISLLRATDPTNPRLAMRQALLDGIQEQQKRHEAMVDQLALIATALELNHLRVIEISGMVNTHASSGTIDDRLLAASEQLGVLVEALRELRD